MPNHCDNYLDILGEKTEVARFYEAIKQGDRIKEGSNEFSILNNLYPTPKELLDGEGWYNWNIENWDTKWGDYDGRICGEAPEHISLGFLSAWCPPIKGIVKVSEQFPTLGFVLTYEEGGMQFCGVVVIQNGTELKHIEGKYPSIGFEGDATDEEQHDRYDELVDKIHDVMEGLQSSGIANLREFVEPFRPTKSEILTSRSG